MHVKLWYVFSGLIIKKTCTNACIFILGLKEEAEIGNRSRHGSGASSSGERLEPPDIPPSMEQTLNIILLKLGDKRRDAKRPEDVDVRTTLISGWY